MAICAVPDWIVATSGACPGCTFQPPGAVSRMPCGANETGVVPAGRAGTDMSGGLPCSLPQPPRTTQARSSRRRIAASLSVARAGMRREVDVLQALRGEVRVDLRRGDVGVAEHLLDGAQVAAACEQVRRERVAQRVRAHLVREAGRARVSLNDLVEAL